ncbi:hypothetical protein [Polaromonas sp. CG9_12]|nr:hypothetical protein [Polaromonas sp. CG9_12]
MSMFLQPPEIAELTGVRSGLRGKTRETRQIEALRKMKIPHYVNAANRPIVARTTIEGRTTANEPTHPIWKPLVG